MEIIIKPLYDLEIRWIDEVKGFGIFTNQFIEKNKIVEVCYSLILKQSDIQHPNHDYLFYHQLTNEHYLPFGYGSIYNHSDDANLDWKLDITEKGIIKFFSLRDIEKDEELCHNYGIRYWQSRKKKLI